MDDSRVTKACVFGWMAELERYPKPVGRGRKTVCYWKKILREAGLDYTDIYGLTSDRKKWKGLITERMKAISKGEDSQGHTWQGEQPLRNAPVVAVQVFDCRVCGKVCKSKGGLVNHRRRIHEKSAARKFFKCEACEQEFGKESELKNHSKVCGGAVASEEGKVKCVCGKHYSKSYFRKHRVKCDAWRDAHPQPEVSPSRAPRTACDVCGKWMRKDNLARHSREACPGGEAGP